MLRISSSAFSGSARSRSILFTNTTLGRPSSSARCHTRSVCTSTPSGADTSTTAASAAIMEKRVSKMKLPSPGVSMMLSFFFFHSTDATAVEMVIPRSISSCS